EGVVAAGATFLVECGDRARHFGEGGLVIEVSRHETKTGGKLLPHLLVEVGASILSYRVVYDLGEVFVVPLPPRETGQCEGGWQQATVGQVVDGRQQLGSGQVTSDAEDDQPGRSSDAGQTPIAGHAQRVLLALLGGH